MILMKKDTRRKTLKYLGQLDSASEKAFDYLHISSKKSLFNYDCMKKMNYSIRSQFEKNGSIWGFSDHKIKKNNSNILKFDKFIKEKIHIKKQTSQFLTYKVPNGKYQIYNLISTQSWKNSVINEGDFLGFLSNLNQCMPLIFIKQNMIGIMVLINIRLEKNMLDN